MASDGAGARRPAKPHPQSGDFPVPRLAHRFPARRHTSEITRQGSVLEPSHREPVDTPTGPGAPKGGRHRRPRVRVGPPLNGSHTSRPPTPFVSLEITLAASLGRSARVALPASHISELPSSLSSARSFS